MCIGAFGTCINSSSFLRPSEDLFLASAPKFCFYSLKSFLMEVLRKKAQYPTQPRRHAKHMCPKWSWHSCFILLPSYNSCIRFSFLNSLTLPAVRLCPKGHMTSHGLHTDTRFEFVWTGWGNWYAVSSGAWRSANLHVSEEFSINFIFVPILILVPNSFLFLVRPGAPSSVLATSSQMWIKWVDTQVAPQTNLWRVTCRVLGLWATTCIELLDGRQYLCCSMKNISWAMQLGAYRSDLTGKTWSCWNIANRAGYPAFGQALEQGMTIELFRPRHNDYPFVKVCLLENVGTVIAGS